MRLKDEHYINDKWIDCKPALLREEIKQEKVILRFWILTIFRRNLNLKKTRQIRPKIPREKQSLRSISLLNKLFIRPFHFLGLLATTQTNFITRDRYQLTILKLNLLDKCNNNTKCLPTPTSREDLRNTLQVPWIIHGLRLAFRITSTHLNSRDMEGKLWRLLALSQVCSTTTIHGENKIDPL